MSLPELSRQFRDSTNKSLFASFSSEKEDTSLLHSINVTW
jgi:hypothetical protein